MNRIVLHNGPQIVAFDACGHSPLLIAVSFARSYVDLQINNLEKKIRTFDQTMAAMVSWTN